MILPVLNSSIKNTPDINFKGRLVRQASEIKNFPKLTCPVCGGPIIAPDVLADAYRVVSLPLKSVLKLDFLDKTKKMPKVWEILLNFAKKYPKKSLDKILENEEEHDIFRNSIEKTIVPDLDRENKEEYEKHMRDFNSVESKIKECARGKLRSSSIVINRFKSFIPMLKKIEENAPYKMDVQAKIGAFEELAYFCELYPKKRTSEILSEPSIKEYVRVMKTATEEGIRNKQKYYFSKIRDIVYKETSCTKSEAVAFVNDLKDVFINSDKDIGARFYNTRKFARNFLTEQNSLRIYAEIEKIINKIPESLQNKYSVLEHCLDKRNDSEIIDDIFKSYTGNDEHVIPRSHGGGNYRSNRIAMHIICNKGRANKPYPEEIEIYPDFPKNMRKQIKQVSKYIIQDKMDSRSKLHLYPPQIKETLYFASEGAIDINVADYCRKSIPIFAEKIKKSQRKINSRNSERDRLIKKLHKCSDEQERELIREKIEKVVQEQKNLITEIKYEKYCYNSLKDYLKNELKKHQNFSDNL